MVRQPRQDGRRSHACVVGLPSNHSGRVKMSFHLQLIPCKAGPDPLILEFAEGDSWIVGRGMQVQEDPLKGL